MIYYIADLHLRDKRVFDLCKRPFNTTEDYEQKLVRLWNDKVNAKDNIYILGDIVLEGNEAALDVIKKFNGQKHLIVGNHDLSVIDKIIKSNIFASIEFWKLVEDNDRKVFICHYPCMDWMKSEVGSYHVYGHIHNKELKDIKTYYKNRPAYNASVDVVGFVPVTLDEMIKLKEEHIDEPYIN